MMDGIDQLSIEDLERIDQTCCLFEKELKQGNGCDLRAYLNGAKGRERATLLFELLSLEIDYRRRRGQEVSPDRYDALFPDDGTVIEKAFARCRPQALPDTAKTADTATHVSAGQQEGPAEPPKSIGRYRILTQIASGGFGVVYRGFDEELQRDVAIKVPHRSVISDGRHAERFLAEARLTANLNHPNIVPVYDVGRTDQGECYVVAKFMEGGDLSARIRRQRPSPAEAAAIVAQIADALHTAHEQRLIHRDIKPSNLLLDAHGGVYLADFGAAVQESSSNVIGFVGTPAYMSPEQARGEGHRVDFRTDIFALGVVLYELMTGVRPFHSQSVTQLLADIIASDPVPPRQINAEIPGELERVCLKAMSKRAADRYPTAREFCWDLRAWSDDQRQVEDAEPGQTLPVVPKGLRSFDATDAEFFLQLLPGPRDRHGLPESIRFWKARIEENLPDQAFRVGVIYGPSGSGKSSLIKAGCLPRLGRRLRPVYVEAHATETEKDLERALQKVCGWEGSLPDLLRRLRKGRSAGAPKILIVIDQFEQWLHAHEDLSAAALTTALRQCDGANVQCLLLVRDDFWMPLVRFMAALEVPLVDGDNTMAIDLFDLAHAKKVLLLFGQAYEKLPEKVAELTREQKQFLADAVAALQHDGSVSPVRMSLFAEMMKYDAWVPTTLRRVGGAEGPGVAFLDRCFSRAESPPPNRSHAEAARNVLKALLPEAGVRIRGHYRSAAELAAVSGYGDRPERFEDLLRLLDQRIRLVTPTDPEADATDADPRELGITPPPEKQYYQLTHDFMVEPIREWVTHEQRQTIRGRAELCLGERAAMWTAKPESRQLPGFLEWASILLFTDSRTWTPPQQKMLRSAARKSAIHLLTAAACIALVVLVGWQAAARIRANSALATVRRADTEDLLEVIRDTEPVRRWLTPLLKKELAAGDVKDQDRQHLRLALLRDDQEQANILYNAALTAAPQELLVIRDGIVSYAKEDSQAAITAALWTILQDEDAENERRFHAACMLAGLDPKSPHWNDYSEDIAIWLVDRPIDEVADWLATLRPVSPYLVNSLELVFLEMESEGRHNIAAFALADFLEDADELEHIVELIKRAQPSQLPLLVGTLKKRRNEAIALLKEESEIAFAEHSESIPPNRKTPPTSLVEVIEDAQGIVTSRFALCQMLPFKDLSLVVGSLRGYDYRPMRIRPFRHADQLFVAGIWTRDDYDWRIEIGISADTLQKRKVEYRQLGLGLEELAAYYQDDQWRFIAIWSAHPAAQVDSRDTSLEERDAWQAAFDSSSAARRYPHTYQYAVGDEGVMRLTQIWRPLHVRATYEQRFAVSEDRFVNGGQNYIPIDVSAHLPWNDRPYGVVWQVDPYVDCHTLVLESPEELVLEGKTQFRNGFQPTAINLASGKDRRAPLSISVWQRPKPSNDARRRFADIKSNVVVALLALGDTDTTLPHLRHAADPTLRSYVIKKMEAARVPIDVLHACIADGSLQADVRQAVILALGNHARSAVPLAKRTRIGETLQDLFITDPDVGVHSASEWVLHQWSVPLPIVEGSHTDADALDHRNWYVTPWGQSMVVMHYPDTYQLTRATEPPSGHRFAIGTKEVTVQEFARFRPETLGDHATREDGMKPANDLDWYAAVAYCNWLNEQEGIPQDQWCYQPNEEGEYAEGLTIPSDFLARRGYRLPTSAEWLYSATTGVRVDFFFGTDGEHLLDYAWMARNSQGTHHPVGTLQPNVFGMFDVFGNVKEWSHNLEEERPDDVRVSSGEMRSVLGGCYMHFQPQFRAYYAKHGNLPDLVEDRNGFRIARTLFPPRGD